MKWVLELRWAMEPLLFDQFRRFCRVENIEVCLIHAWGVARWAIPDPGFHLCLA